MAKTSCIQRMPKETYITLRQSYINICGGNVCAAALLDYYEYRYNGLLDNLLTKKGNDKRYIEQPSDFLIEASYNYVQTGLMGLYGRSLIIKGNTVLEDLGFIKVVHKGINTKGGSPTTKVLFNVDAINQHLEINAGLNEQRLEVNAAAFKSKRSEPKPAFKNKHKEESLLKEEEREESAPAKDFSESTQNEEEKGKEKSCAKKEKALPFQPIRTAAELKEALVKIYTADPAKLENVKDTFSVYKTNWTKSGMRAALTKFSNWYFSKPDSIPVFDENKADTLFLNALNWLCKEVKDYKDEPTTATANKTPQNENKAAISKEYECLILEYIEAKTNGEVKLKSISEIKPISREQRLMDMGLTGGETAMRERIKTYKSKVA